MERNTNTQQTDERNMYGLYASDAILLGENPYAGVEHTSDGFSTANMHTDETLFDQTDTRNPDIATGGVSGESNEWDEAGMAIAEEDSMLKNPDSTEGDLDALTEQWLAAGDAAREEIETIFTAKAQERRDTEFQ